LHLLSTFEVFVPTESALVGASANAIAAARALVVAYLADKFPLLAVRGGQLSDLIALPATDALAAVNVRADAVIASSDPETALASGGYDPAILNVVLAGRGVTRIPAAFASGAIAIHLSSYVAVNIPAGYRVTTSDGTVYATNNAVRVLAPEAIPLSTSEIAAVIVPEGGFAVVVSASAAVVGAHGNRAAGTALTAVNPLAQQTAVYIALDMQGGADAETDAALLARLPTATAPRSVASNRGAAAVVTDAYPYSTVTVLGFGHPGMRRGRSALTGQSPGRSDVRVRTSDAPSRVRVRVTATLISTAPFGLWRFV
jgi:hypothetical protein